MNLVPLDQTHFETAKHLYDEGVQWSPRTIVPDGGLWTAAVQSPTSLWRLAFRTAFDKDGDSSWEFVGLAGFENINLIDRVCEPYIAVTPELRKTGISLLLAEKMREFAVKQLGMQRIQSLVLENSPSRKILDRMGFEVEGTLRRVRYKDGEHRNAIMYAWLRS